MSAQTNRFPPLSAQKRSFPMVGPALLPRPVIIPPTQTVKGVNISLPVPKPSSQACCIPVPTSREAKAAIPAHLNEVGFARYIFAYDDVTWTLYCLAS